MKKLLMSFLLSSACCWLAVSAPVRSMLGADGAEKGDEWNPTAADYIQDGLIVMYDAIENAGVGLHDPNATVWTELVGLPFVSCNLPMRDHTILDNGILCESRLPMAKRPADPYAFMAEISEGYTMQLAITQSDDEMPGGLAGLNAGGFYFRVGNDSYGRWFGYSTFQPKMERANRNFPQHTTLSIAADSEDNYTRFLYDEIVWFTSQSFSIFAADNTYYPAIGINSSGRVHDSYGAGAGNGVVYHNFRIYNRALTPDEISHNNRIDKARFGL